MRRRCRRLSPSALAAGTRCAFTSPILPLRRGSEPAPVDFHPVSYTSVGLRSLDVSAVAPRFPPRNACSLNPGSSVDEVAKHLGVAKDSVYRWIDTKGLPAKRVGRLWKFGGRFWVLLLFSLGYTPPVSKMNSVALRARSSLPA